jgi:hypothetical protein
LTNASQIVIGHIGQNNRQIGRHISQTRPLVHLIVSKSYAIIAFDLLSQRKLAKVLLEDNLFGGSSK